MSLPDYVFKQIKCCLSADDSHIIIEPVILKCGGNACKECVIGSFKCLHCNNTHSNDDYTDCKSVESLIRFVMKDLNSDLDDQIRSTKDLLKSFYLFCFLNSILKLEFFNR